MYNVHVCKVLYVHASQIISAACNMEHSMMKFEGDLLRISTLLDKIVDVRGANII